MKLFEILNLKFPEIVPKKTKVHLAVWNGEDNPLDVYLKGDFEGWQSWQTKKNFQREWIVSLIQLPGSHRWIFAGCFEANGSDYIKENNLYRYKTSEISSLKELSGRLVVSFERSGRQSYLNAENWCSDMDVDEVMKSKMVVESFKGYNRSLISKSKLDIIIKQNIESWHAALSNVAGIYLITDTASGKLYVGSATGDGGIWQRWNDYSNNGHGGNKELVKILKDKGKDYAQNFQYSILEIADTHASNEEVIQRESYWKRVLKSKEYGYNAN